MDRKGQDSVDQGTIHVCSGGPKFGGRYYSSIGICRGPTVTDSDSALGPAGLCSLSRSTTPNLSFPQSSRLHCSRADPAPFFYASAPTLLCNRQTAKSFIERTCVQELRSRCYRHTHRQMARTPQRRVLGLVSRSSREETRCQRQN
jgi:hypothetical protein